MPSCEKHTEIGGCFVFILLN